MTNTTIYTTRDEAIQREIIDPIEASGEVTDARAEYDIEAIADEVLGDYAAGYAPKVDADEFWAIVERHARQDTTWLTTVGFGGNPAPRGPWRTADEARESLSRWVRREGADAASLIAAHTIRVYAYTTREAARAGDISDSPGRNGCVSIRGLDDFLGGAQ
jgi:hypothetical protein